MEAIAGQRSETRGIVHDPPSFDEVYNAHQADLTVQLFAYFGDRQEAQDVVQEAFCRAYSRWKTVSRYEDPVAWVRRVAWNLAVSRWRRARTAMSFLHRQRPVEPLADGPGPERVALVAALATLPVLQLAGTAAVRRTVRRRRMVRAAVAAAVAVVAMTGGLVAGLRPAPPALAPATRPPTPVPDLSDQLIEQDRQRVLAEKALVASSRSIAGFSTFLDAEITRQVSNPDELKNFVLRVACVGEGWVEVHAFAGSKQVMGDLAACGRSQAKVTRFEFTVPAGTKTFDVRVLPISGGEENAIAAEVDYR